MNNDNMQDILKNYYAAGGKTLFENQTLLEYNRATTMNKWGERIAKAAEFNVEHLGDNWFNSNADMRNYEPDGPEAEEFIAELVLEELEKMDPTKNKQYVMTLVRWYIGSIKKHNQLQAKWEYVTADDRQEDLSYPPPENYTDMGGSGYIDSLSDEDFESFQLDPQNLDTFKLEDSEQIKSALANFERMKPQLQPNERDIGRYKSFYRFEDFVDSKMDPELKAEIESELLNRSDVEVLYNGPLGTVTIPRSHKASCELGSGTKWCTAGRESHYYDSYSSRGDLIIYNEKPGNNKYQIHVTLDGIEARDARDRLIPPAKKTEFTKKHPVLSKIIKAEEDKLFTIMAQKEYRMANLFTRNGSDPVELVRDFIRFNAKHKGGVMRYVDEYYVEHALPDILKKSPLAPGREFFNLMLTYAKQRGKPWPEAQKLLLAITTGVADSADLSSNTELKTVNRLAQHTEELGSTPELAQFKTDLLKKIQSQSNTNIESVDLSDIRV